MISGWLWGSGGFETLQTRVGRINAMGRFWVGMAWCWMGGLCECSSGTGPLYWETNTGLVRRRDGECGKCVCLVSRQGNVILNLFFA